MNKSEVSYIRDYTAGDKHFVLATWLRGLYYGDTLYSLIEKQTFMTYYHAILERLLEGKEIKINVMCLTEDPNVIVGYSVLRPDATTLHWVFVKKSFRGNGVATDLVPETVKVVTHLTKAGIAILKNKGLSYNPFVI